MTIPQALQTALHHHQAGRMADAEALYRQILAVQPNHPDALNLLGKIASQAGRHEIAADLIRRAIAVSPSDWRYYFGLGNALLAQGRLDEAIAAYRATLQFKPDFEMALNNLGVASRAEGNIGEAVGACRRALQIKPDYAEAWYNLGLALQSQGHADEAIAAIRRALELQPSFPDARNDLGNALMTRGELDEAIAEYRHALQLKPDDPEIHTNLGNALWEGGRTEEAICAYRGALQLKPDYLKAHNNMGVALARQGQLAEAMTAYRHALRLEPDLAWVHSNLIYALHFHQDYNGRMIADEQRRWNRLFSEPLKQYIQPHANDCTPERRLRVGYVSPDFRDHPVGRYVLPLFERHDCEQFEILCYSGVLKPDWMTERFRTLTGKWRNIVGVPDARLAEMIREDSVDILVDLSQHMAGNRLPVFARKPAPIQVSFAGYPESTGLEAIEYRISDRYLETGPHDAAVRQERVCLIDSFYSYDPRGIEVEVNPLPALENGTVTFGCLNNLCKVNERVLSLWARVLGEVKNSRLVISSPAGSHRQRTQEAFGREGVAASRVEFVDFRPRREYLELYHRLDVLLDTFPYNGGVTTCDALWMGVAVVSLAGKTPVSRAGVSLLTNVGLPELIARSETEYVNIASRMAGDLPHLAELRSAIRDRMKTSAVMNASGFTRQVEQVYREAWETWCAKQSTLRRE
jgi:protein O-GlcNAc transferase